MMIDMVRMNVPDEVRDEVVQILRSIRGPTRALRGCVRCGVYEDMDADGAIVLCTEWSSHEDHLEFLRSAQFASVLIAVELLRDSPQFAFYEVECREGLEAVRAARVRDGARGE
jgi:quinol monooxygenase YgiN